ncbi:MAG: hypothetical protein Q4D55_04135 [Eubacteriales bacterium]|nr:hypothetical protein [Eubacteriales bacterium]
MYDGRVQYALDHFICDDYFLAPSERYCLKEGQDSGKSELNVSLNDENLCISDFDNKGKCNFLKNDKKYGMQKSVDHIIFQKRENGWVLNLLEMKSSVGNETWISIKQKVRTSYLTACALAVFLGIDIQDTYVYTTYETDKFNKVSGTTNPKVYTPPLGERAVDFKSEEWDKDIISIKVYDKITFHHRGIKMARSKHGDFLEGELAL